MDPLVSLLVRVRRRAREALPMLAVALLGAAVLLHAVHPLGAIGFGALGLLLGTVVLARVWQRARSSAQRWVADLEIGVLLVLLAFAVVVELDGGLAGQRYPLVYLAIGVVSAFVGPGVTVSAVALSVGFEALLLQLAYGGLSLAAIGPHALLAVAFGLLSQLTIGFEVARLRRAAHGALETDRQRLREVARDYRLLRAPRDTVDEGTGQTPSHPGRSQPPPEEQLLVSGVEEIHLSVLFSLRLLRESLGAHTAILLWLDVSGRELRIAELVSDQAVVAEGPFAAGDGIAGMVLSQRAAVCFADTRPTIVLPYYPGACPVKAACAVPVFEHGALHGVLIVDRLEPRPFSPEAQQLVEQAARFAARAVENERVFVQLERTKVEQGKLYRAVEALAAAVTEQDVVEAGVSSAREITSVDFAAFTSFDVVTDSHVIRAVSGEGRTGLVGHCFPSNAGLVSMALRNGHPLPYRGAYDPSRQVVFAKGISPPAVPSLLVLPLGVRDMQLGTLVLGSRTPGAFNGAARGLLEVLASHLAVSLSNARMVRRLEEQATTDPLTGLLNKRAMHDAAKQMISSAKRFGRPLSVLIADIDLFKRVNDTYGHDVGDVVIKELGKIHKRATRTIDAVARFGGEEFVTICEETDADGAMLLAERIRAEFSRTAFHARGQEIHCTCSVGIATFPDAATSWEDLFKASDEALYTSKRAGRDRATIWSGGGRRSAAA